ncbi:MAG: oligosaccharide flippase family protein [Ardenticatenaceae bacterium]|nr:oligosaccharide flippase family protein [Ardenticatenaceae bacterium]
MPQIRFLQNKVLHNGLVANVPAAKKTVINWSVILTGLLFQNGLNAVSLILVARQVPPVAYGQYLATYSLVSFLVILPGFGMDAWLLTQPQLTSDSTTALWFSTFRIRTIFLIIWGVLMAILSILLPKTTYPFSLIYPTIIGVSFDALTLLAYASLRTQNRHILVAVVQSFASIILFALVLSLPINQTYVSSFAFGRMVLSIGVSLVTVYIMGKDHIGRSLQLTTMRQILISSRPFLSSELAASVYIKADVTILSLMIGSAATAVYGPAINILQAFNLVTIALFYLIVPRISKTFITQRSHFLSQSLTQLIVQAITGLILSIIMWLLASCLVIYIFGAEYNESIKIIRFLSPIPFLRSLNFGLAAIIIAGNRQKSRSKIQTFAAIFNVLGNILIIGILGVTGVSIMFDLSELFLVIGYSYLLIDIIHTIKNETQ